MNTVVKEEILYTYDAAISRYERERHREWLCRQKKIQKIREHQKLKRQKQIKQKFYGLIISCVGISTMFLGIGEGILLIIAGIAITATKEIILN